MTDVVDTKTRSRMMAGIRGKDTRPELMVRKFLHRRGFRFRLHVRTLAGRPDIVLPRYRAVVNVHGCFWHAHPGCRYAARPSTRAKFWKRKLAVNRERDARNRARLEAEGWRVFTVWECGLRQAPEATLETLAGMLGSGAAGGQIPEEPARAGGTRHHGGRAEDA